MIVTREESIVTYSLTPTLIHAKLQTHVHVKYVAIVTLKLLATSSDGLNPRAWPTIFFESIPRPVNTIPKPLSRLLGEKTTLFSELRVFNKCPVSL